MLPVRDASTTLDAALRSVRRQTIASWECVVVDDGSRDDSLAIARRHAQRDARIVVVPQVRSGLVPALRAGLEVCRAPLVARMDADDLMHAERLDRQVARLESETSLDLLGTHVRLFPRAALGPGWRAYERWNHSISSPSDVRREAFIECPVVHPTLAARTATLRDLGYRDRDWPEDYDLILRALGSGRRVAVEPRRLLSWRRTPHGLSAVDRRYDDEAFARCRAHFLAHGPLAGTARYRLWGYGATGRMLAACLEHHGRRPERIVDVHPRRVGQAVRGAPVVAPDGVGPPGGSVLLASVAGAGPRGRIRAFLADRGFVEGRDFVCVA